MLYKKGGFALSPSVSLKFLVAGFRVVNVANAITFPKSKLLLKLLFNYYLITNLSLFAFLKLFVVL